MHYPVIVLLVFITGILYILLSKASILLEYIRSSQDDHIVISLFALGGLVKQKYEIPIVDLGIGGIRARRVKKRGKKEKVVEQEKKKFGFNELVERIRYIKRLLREKQRIFNYLRFKLLVGEIELEVRAGTGDASQTGIMAGALWALAGFIESQLLNNFRVLKKKIHVYPDFTRKIFKVDFYCIFHVRIAHIIVVVFMVAPSYLEKKIREITERRKKHGGTPNRRSHDNCNGKY